MKSTFLVIAIISTLIVPAAVFSAPGVNNGTTAEAANEMLDAETSSKQHLVPTWLWVLADVSAWIVAANGAFHHLMYYVAAMAIKKISVPGFSMSLWEFGYTPGLGWAIGGGAVGAGIMYHIYNRDSYGAGVQVSSIELEDIHEQFVNIKVVRKLWEESISLGMESVSFKADTIVERQLYYEMLLEYLDAYDPENEVALLESIENEIVQIEDEAVHIGRELSALTAEEESLQIATEDLVLDSVDLGDVRSEVARRVSIFNQAI